MSQINVEPIFDKVKDLDKHDKMLLKKASKMPFERLPWITQALVYSITKDSGIKTHKDKDSCYSFLTNMIAAYIGQDCRSGKAFEDLLKKLYATSDKKNASVKLKVGYMCDERDNRVRMDSIKRYVALFSKENNIDIVKLTSDVLNWSGMIKDAWTKTIAGINNKETEDF